MTVPQNDKRTAIICA